jgi:Putative peptidoglycan binding domain
VVLLAIFTRLLRIRSNYNRCSAGVEILCSTAQRNFSEQPFFACAPDSERHFQSVTASIVILVASQIGLLLVFKRILWGSAMQKSILSRRRMLTMTSGIVASQLTGPTAAQSAAEGEISDAMAADILYEDSEGVRQRTSRAFIKPFWFEQSEGTRPSPTWPTDNVSFDYAHLTAHANTENDFALTPAVLEQLLALQSLQCNPQFPKLLFGLRGCVLAADNTDRTTWRASHQVRATRPNHIDLKCLIGVWDTANNAIALFSGSTVPNVDLMGKQIEGSLGCNMMPAGLHHYQVGAHRAPRQPGAFRQLKGLWVIRTKKHFYYATNDPDTVWDDLDGDLPFDNIHAAMLSSRTKPPFFSSAGCQVISGAYDANRVPTGAWAEFRKAAGLQHPLNISDSSATPDDGRQFNYALFTGKEAQLVANGAGNAIRVLRYGSSGPAVAALQDKLSAEPAGAGIEKSGVMDRKTLGAVIRWQVANRVAPTGIVVPETAAKLGLNWT